MRSSIPDIPKLRGRPAAGGRKEGVLVRLTAEEIDAIDRWRKNYPILNITRPAAIRKLIAIGLSDSEED